MSILGTGIFALLILAMIYAIGEIIGVISKATIPSAFVIAIIFLVGYWTILPQDIVSRTGLGPPLGGTLTILLIVIHLGTTMSLKELAQQWKTIVNCLIGLAGMIIFCLLIAPQFVDFNYVISGIPPLTGGVTAALIMQQAALKLGLEEAAILALCMYILQSFAGYPITAFMLKKECKRLLKNYREGEVLIGTSSQVTSSVSQNQELVKKKRALLQMPEKFQTTQVLLAKTAFVACLAQILEDATAALGFELNAAVGGLLLGVVFYQIGFLEKDVLKKAGAINFLLFVMMVNLFDGLKNATPDMVVKVIGPLLFIIVVGVAGMTIACLIMSKVMKISPYMACASAYTSLYGFPPNYILTDEATTAMAKTPEEKQYLMDNILPQMIVGGFTSVTVTSVIIAGIFVNFLKA